MRPDRRAQRRAEAVLELQPADVDESDRRRLSRAPGLPVNLQMSIAAAPCVVQRLERRRGGSHQQRNAEQLRAFDREVARRIAEAILLFERTIVFFVDNDQAEARERHEDRAARADHTRASAAAARVPRLRALAFGQARVIDAASPKRCEKRSSVCGVSAISGISTNTCSPRASTDSIDLQIDFGLAAAGDTVEQQALESTDAARAPRSPRVAPASVRSGCVVATAVSTGAGAGRHETFRDQTSERARRRQRQTTLVTRHPPVARNRSTP